MIVFSEAIETSRSKNKSVEIRLNGRAVSRGVAIGKVVCLHGRKRQFYRINLEISQIEREIRRFRAAVRLAKRQLKKIIVNKSETKASIFDTHFLIFEDKSLLSKIEEHIKTRKVNAEWAVKIITDGYIISYKNISDEHLRERYIDLEDVAERLQTALGGGGKPAIRLEKNSIIVAKEVKPSTLIELVESHPQAIITENGGWTSHTFILARELNLPSITGVKRILRRVQTGDEVVVDAFSGQIILNPNEITRAKYKVATIEFEQKSFEKAEVVKGKTKTLDGKMIKVRANLDLPKGYSEAKRLGVDGIGLYRSEFLFNQYKGFPTENKQIEAYRKIAKLVGDEGVRIRTFDLSVEQLLDETEEKEKNPALGLRAIRLSLTHLRQFRIQLRALLQAAAENNISVVLPMISDVAEILRTKKILEREKQRLRKKKIEFGDLRLGAMIEVPSAILTIDEIAAESDFLCLGTNDLVQYLLAVDRDNETVADWFRTLHPSVLRSIKIVVKAAENAEIPVIVCGEMAGSPLYVPILIGLGVTELSMNINSIPRVKKIISHIAFEEAHEIVKKLEDCKTHDETENLVYKLFSEKWSHLFPASIVPPKIKQGKI
ncbi:MAG: phosphoenolpyruvate--protein phosphotransferase [Pyrinomonadaceae bacterium]